MWDCLICFDLLTPGSIVDLAASSLGAYLLAHGPLAGRTLFRSWQDTRVSDEHRHFGVLQSGDGQRAITMSHASAHQSCPGPRYSDG